MNGAEAEGAVGEENGGGMEAGEAVGKIGPGPAGRVEGRHEGEDADGEQDGGGEGADEFQARQQADQQADEGEGPEEKGDGLVEIVHGAGPQGEAALDEGPEVQEEAGEQEAVVHMVVAPESLAPKEHGMKRARGVAHECEGKEMAVGEPVHLVRLNGE